MNLTIHSLLLTLCAFFIASSASAAELKLSVSSAPKAGESIVVSVLLNTEGASVNALEGALTYPVEALQLREVRDGNSVVNFWIERPQNQEGIIRFAGITPGGYTGTNGQLFSLVFEVARTGNFQFALTDSRALLNDGEGTAIALPLSTKRIDESQDSGGTPILETDTVPPENFQITRSASPDIFEGKPFIVFASQDKLSGIDHYEVAEVGFLRRLGMGIFPLTFERALSPHLLTRSEGAFIFVKAIDKAGNEQLARLSPESASWEAYVSYLLGILLILIGIVFACRYVFSTFKP